MSTYFSRQTEQNRIPDNALQWFGSLAFIMHKVMAMARAHDWQYLANVANAPDARSFGFVRDVDNVLLDWLEQSDFYYHHRDHPRIAPDSAEA